VDLDAVLAVEELPRQLATTLPQSAQQLLLTPVLLQQALLQTIPQFQLALRPLSCWLLFWLQLF